MLREHINLELVVQKGTRCMLEKKLLGLTAYDEKAFGT
jgi:hypothetical protein